MKTLSLIARTGAGYDERRIESLVFGAGATIRERASLVVRPEGLATWRKAIRACGVS
jgi:hypothetical protein